MSENTNRLKSEILHLLENERLRITPSDLGRLLRKRFPETSRAFIKGTVRTMVSDGQLVYTHHFSTTHIEINYHQGVKISDGISLAPPNQKRRDTPGHLTIQLHSGTAFGFGDHPTTRLMLRCMDHLYGSENRSSTDKLQQALDVGTGTGVLAIAAAALGRGRAVGIDIDPIACHEANRNVRLNNLKDRVRIISLPLEDLDGMIFDLVTVNLRPPTIRQLIPKLLKLSSSQAVWILSGFRENEQKPLMENLPLEIFNRIWQKREVGWAAIALKRILSRK